MDEELKELLKEFIIRQKCTAALLVVSIAGKDKDYAKTLYKAHEELIKGYKQNLDADSNFDPLSYFRFN